VITLMGSRGISPVSRGRRSPRRRPRATPDRTDPINGLATHAHEVTRARGFGGRTSACPGRHARATSPPSPSAWRRDRMTTLSQWTAAHWITSNGWAMARQSRPRPPGLRAAAAALRQSAVAAARRWASRSGSLLIWRRVRWTWMSAARNTRPRRMLARVRKRKGKPLRLAPVATFTLLP
jgi:hypothetical protein